MADSGGRIPPGIKGHGGSEGGGTRNTEAKEVTGTACGGNVQSPNTAPSGRSTAPKYSEQADGVAESDAANRSGDPTIHAVDDPNKQRTKNKNEGGPADTQQKRDTPNLLTPKKCGGQFVGQTKQALEKKGSGSATEQKEVVHNVATCLNKKPTDNETKSDVLKDDSEAESDASKQGFDRLEQDKTLSHHYKTRSCEECHENGQNLHGQQSSLKPLTKHDMEKVLGGDGEQVPEGTDLSGSFLIVDHGDCKDVHSSGTDSAGEISHSRKAVSDDRKSLLSSINKKKEGNEKIVKEHPECSGSPSAHKSQFAKKQFQKTIGSAEATIKKSILVEVDTEQDDKKKVKDCIENEEMTVCVKILTGKEIKVDARLTDTPEDIKVKIEEKEGIPPNHQRLIKERTEIFGDQRTLLEYGFDKETTIHLVVKEKKDVDSPAADSAKGMPDHSTEILGVSETEKENENVVEREKTVKEHFACSDTALEPTSEFKHSQKMAAVSTQRLNDDIEHKDDKNKDKGERKCIEEQVQDPRDDASPKNPLKTVEAERDTTHDVSAGDDYPRMFRNSLSEGMQVIVTTLEKKQITVNVRPEDCIKMVKERVADNTDTDLDSWSLTYNGNKLGDDQTLRDCNIGYNATLCVLKPRTSGKKGKTEGMKGSTTMEKPQLKTEPTVQSGGSATTEPATADESDDQRISNYQNDLDSPTGNPLMFTRALADSHTLQEGLDYTLECCVTEADLTAKWFKDENPLKEDERIKSVSSKTTHSLMINNAILKDSGEYTVKIENLQSKSKIIVEEKPVMFTLPLPEKEIAEIGNKVTFRCQVSKPGLDAVWIVGDQQVKNDRKYDLQSTEMSHILTVRNVDMKDNGEYIVRIKDTEARCMLQVYENRKGSPSSESSSCGPASEEDSVEDDFDEQQPSILPPVSSMVAETLNKKEDISKVTGSLDMPGLEKNKHKGAYEKNNDSAVMSFSTKGLNNSALKRQMTPPDISECLGVGEKGEKLVCKNRHETAGKQTAGGLTSVLEKDIHKSKISPLKNTATSVKDRKSIEFEEVICGLQKLDIQEKKARNLDIPVRLNHGRATQLYHVYCSPENFTKWKYLFHSEYSSKHLHGFGVIIKDQQVIISLKERLAEEEIAETTKKYMKMTLDIIKELYVEKISVTKCGHEIVQVIMNSDLAQSQQLYAEYFEEQSLLIYVCHTSVQENVRQEYHHAVKSVIGIFTREFRCQIGLDVVFDIFKIQAQISSKFPGVRLQYRPDYEKGDCECSIEGPNEEVLDKSVEFLEKSVVKEYPYNSFSFENIRHIDMLGETLLEKFFEEELRCIISACTDPGEIHFKINRTAKRIVVIASSQKVADTVVTKFRTCITSEELKQDSLNENSRKMLFDMQEKNKNRMFVYTHEDKYCCIGNTDIVREFMDFCEKHVSVSKESMPDPLSLKPYLPKSEKSKTVEIEDTKKFNLMKKKLNQGSNLGKDVKVIIVENKGKCGFQVIGDDDKKMLETENEIRRMQAELKAEEVVVNVSNEQENEYESLKSHTEETCNVTIDLLNRNALKPSKVVSVSKKHIFENGVKLKVSRGNAGDLWKDVLVELVEGKGISILKNLKEQQRQIQLFVPPWSEKPGEDDGKHALQASVDQVLKLVKAYECTHVCLSLDNCCGWELKKFTKQVMKSVVSYARDVSAMPIIFQFCLGDKQKFQECCKTICETVALEDTESDDCQEKEKAEKLEKKQTQVHVVGGKLNEFEADVLVNTTSTDLDLKCGAVSLSLHKDAGMGMQRECKRRYREGIKPGEIAVTDGYKLNCKKVFHGALEEYIAENGGVCLQKLGNFVLACLDRATALDLKSIAFPAIGTGNLNYPIEDVMTVMFNSVKLFREKPGVKNRMLEVYFVIFPEWSANMFKRKNMEVSKGEEQKPCRPRPPTSRQITVSPVKVNAQIGSLKICESTDALIYFWDKKKLYGVEKMNDFLQAAGIVADFFNKRDSSKRQTAFITNGGKLGNHRIIHVPVKNEKECLMQGFRDGMLLADKAESSSVTAFFERSSPFLIHQGKLGSEMIEAVKDIAPRLKYLKHVTLVAEEMKNPKKIFEAFGSEKVKEERETRISMDLRIIGFQTDIEKAKQMLAEWSKSAVETMVLEHSEPDPVQEPGTSLVAPEPQSMDRTEMCQPDQDSELPLEKFVPAKREFLEGYVLVSNVPQEYKFETLSAKLLGSGCLPVGIKQLIYKNGSKNALVVCTTSKDADVLSGYDQEIPFEFRSIEKQVLSPLELVIQRGEVNLMKKQGTLECFLKELKDLKADVNEGVELKVKVLTTCQMGWVLELKKKYCEKNSYITFSAEDGFEHVILTEQLISDVSERIWNIMQIEKEQDIKEFEKSCGKLNFTGKAITLTKEKDASEETFIYFQKKFNRFVEQFKNMEYEEVDVDSVYMENISDWMNEIDRTMEKKCCTLFPNERKVVVYFDTYEGVRQIRHHFLVKQRKIKTTGRRRKADISGESGPSSLQQGCAANTVEENIKGKQIYSCFEWSRDATNVKWYKTPEEINVCVYEANILNLDVDCIVNAANNTLSHGGGVAKVIADGAGKQLEQEGSEYIRVHGKIPVGGAMSTSPGKLPYKRVIHAVGPRWSEYTYSDREKCENHLIEAIYNSFMEAEKWRLKKIALPAISSAIFGVPEDLCVSMYVRATLTYSQDQTPFPLAEIHFIDKNPKIINLLQEEFDTVLNRGEVSPYIKKSNRGGQRRHGKSNASDMSYGQDTVGISPYYMAIGKMQTVFTFCGREDKQLLVSQGDVLSVEHEIIVVTVNDRRKEGSLARNVSRKIHKSCEEQYQQALQKQISRNCQVGTVAITDGYGSGFYKIFHVVFPFTIYHQDENLRRKNLKEAYHNVFYRAVNETTAKAVSTTLIGIDDSKPEDVDLCADVFLEEYILFAKDKLSGKSGTFNVHLVLHKQANYERVSEKFRSFVDNRQQLCDRKTKGQREHSDREESDEENHYESIKSVTSNVEDNIEREDCVICMETMKNVKTLKCGHRYCRECIDTHFNFKKTCPTCGAVCGVITGDQPPGTMQVYRYSRYHCAGYEDCGQIQISYSFLSGRQQDYHPDPGKWYKGINRIAYLPDNDEGRLICEMLKVAFDRNLVFTIGSSRTTGHEGVITWNDIHHKTDPRKNTQFGYPDPTYLSRVREELEAKGVTEADIKKKKN